MNLNEPSYSYKQTESNNMINLTVKFIRRGSKYIFKGFINIVKNTSFYFFHIFNDSFNNNRIDSLLLYKNEKNNNINRFNETKTNKTNKTNTPHLTELGLNGSNKPKPEELNEEFDEWGWFIVIDN